MKGATIRQRLAQVGMTQVELSRLLGVTPQTVNKILNTENVQTGTLERICEVMHMPITFFYNESDDIAAPSLPPSPSFHIRDEGERTGKESKLLPTSSIGDKVRGLLRSQHKKMGALCQHVGMTDPGLRRAFVRDSCNVNVLLRIADFFNVPVTYFLPEDRHAKAETEKDREIEYLKGQLKAYENTLAIVLRGMKGADDVDLFAIHTADE